VVTDRGTRGKSRPAVAYGDQNLRDFEAEVLRIVPGDRDPGDEKDLDLGGGDDR